MFVTDVIRHALYSCDEIIVMTKEGRLQEAKEEMILVIGMLYAQNLIRIRRPNCARGGQMSLVI